MIWFIINMLPWIKWRKEEAKERPRNNNRYTIIIDNL